MMVSSTTPYPFDYIVMTNTSTSTSIYPYPYQKPRRSYKKKVREIPNFTSGLEGKLYDALDQDATNIIRYLIMKAGDPTVSNTYDCTMYTFEKNIFVQRPYSSAMLFDPNFFDPLPTRNPMMDRKSIQFKVKLDVRGDGTLSKFTFNYGAST